MSILPGVFPVQPPRHDPPPVPRQHPFRRDPRLAAVYDQEVAPVWTGPFGRLLLDNVCDLGGATPSKANLLEVVCHTGDLAFSLLDRFATSRLIAIDPSASLIEVARRKAGRLLGQRLFLRSDESEPRLRFDDAVFDLVVSNLGLHEAAQPHLLLRELSRVAKPGAQVLATLPLQGTFDEFFSLLETELRLREIEQQRLASYRRTWPDAETVKSWANAAGLSNIRLDVAPFSLLFGGAEDFYYSPVIEFGPLSDWKALFDHDKTGMHTVFQALREKIEARCAKPNSVPGLPCPVRRPFVLTVRAACLCACRPA